LPASGCEMIAKVRRRSTASDSSVSLVTMRSTAFHARRDAPRGSLRARR
jgi:hypothetical protein